VFNNLEDVLHGVHLVHECSAGSLDLILSFGEQLSARILTYYFNISGIKSQLVDSRELVRTFGPPGKTYVQAAETYRLIREKLLPYQELCVITGYIASNQDGVTTTLGRKGSDFTATLFGVALEASAIEIWTNRDGIYTADPKLVPDARVIDRMKYEEVQEMSYFGADLIHPQSLQPAAEKNIPVKIRNIFNLQHPGTLISRSNGHKDQQVCGITTIDDVALVNLEGSGMIGIPGIAGRLFTALAEHEVNIIMISQASSEQSICFIVRRSQIEPAVNAVKKTFEIELNAGLIQHIEQLENLVVLSVIGSSMRGTIGISGRFFGALGSSGVNVLAISQGSSEKNISIIIAETDKQTALNAVHTAFITDLNLTTDG
jgi:aspartokinase/homoserine dehydrogenase 1